MPTPIYRVAILQIDGVELLENTELSLKAENIHIVNPAGIGFPVTDDNVRLALKSARESGDSAIFPITLQHNGTVGNNTVFGYSSLIPGDDTPVVIQAKAEMKGFTFSNKNSNADYTLEFRKNSLTAPPFHTSSKVNTKFYAENLSVTEPFNQGDVIYVKYIDDGQNASDVGMLLTFKAVP